MNYYTSDLHLGHVNIMKYEPNRPGTDIFEMNKILIDNINSTVNENDHLYILGDFAFNTAKHKVGSIIQSLTAINCKVHLILGNHDASWINSEKFKFWNRDIEITTYKELYDGPNYVVLCHYPLEIWNHKHHGAYHLHGHTHGTNEENIIQNRFNVGCMLHNYKPVTLLELIGENNEK